MSCIYISKRLVSIAAALCILLTLFGCGENTEKQYEAAVEKYGQKLADTVLNAEAGDIITLGTYEQDNDSANGAEGIEWIVLDKKGTSLLLVSRNVLINRNYNGIMNSPSTWETCMVRGWLNGDFISGAFSENERELIKETDIINEKNPEYGTDPGNPTKDRIFLLSISEAEKYFPSDGERKCGRSESVRSSEPSQYQELDSCIWWLRSPGAQGVSSARVMLDGSIDRNGFVQTGDMGIRPAMWIDI